VSPEANVAVIAGFHQDDEGHWVAELSCGHGQHVRHNPPWQNRPWTQTETGRRARLGERLRCRKCERDEA
jgi:hypothetical protein